MFVKAIVLDGFKSYGNRTEINGFDKQFNAITGLNGSGKSNILDAICFVLGLQNLSQVRAQLLQDLVYKQGQSGVTKASATITFDNTDKEKSPIGYETYGEIVITRSVVIGGKNKYLVNGVNATNNRVKDLFLSVQLNVNNPHFLVMQGRIAKVICMKPMEILSMIEEASGTRMFETKKLQAEKTLQKKDSKLAAIDEIINEDISPKLTKLKEERVQYLEYKKVERELEYLQKVYIAWKYLCSKDISEKAKEQAEKLIEKINEKRLAIKSGESELDKINAHVEELQKQKDTESGGKLAEVEAEIREREKELTKNFGVQKQNCENVDDEKKRIKQLEKNIVDDDKLLKSKSGSLSKIDGVFQGLASEEDKDKTDLEKAQHKFQALSSGLVADDSGAEGTLQDKLMASERAKAEAQTEIEQCKRQKVHCEQDLKKKTAELQKNPTDFHADTKMLQSLEKEVKGLQKQLQDLNFDEAGVTGLQQEDRQLQKEARELRNTRDAFESRDGRLTFRYSDPERNFNRNSVHGLVCKLIEVNDPQFAIAVEKTAGGRLFNVVVDTDITSKKLLNHGKLERRTTIIPLNKISGRRLNPRVVQAAEKIGGRNNVWPAISLIEYSDVLQPAMEYIFGSTLICRDLATAKKVCYHPEVKTRCVTLDGDTCDPSGTLSGGARQQTQPVLIKLQEIKAVLRDLDVRDIRLAEIERLLRQMGGQQDKYLALKQKLDLQEHELNLVRQRLQQTSHYQHQEEINALKEQIAQFTKRQEECQAIISRETLNIKEVQDKVKNAKANRAKELKGAEDEVKRLKKKAEQSRKEREKRTEEYDSLKLELEDLKKSIETNKEQIEKHKASIIQLEQKGAGLETQVREGKEAVKAIQAELKSVKELINKKNKEIAQAIQRKEQIVKEALNSELEIKQYQQDHDKLKQESKDGKHRVADLLKQHEWIAQEEEYFGKPNGLYDFKQTDPHEAGKRVGKLQELKDKLGRNVNTKAMAHLEKTEEQYNDFMKKRQQVQQDKEKILEVIEELGEKKKEVLKEACSQVNRDFGSIFKSLLPGAIAKLVPSNKQSVLDGLEFRVGFGGKFKESLGELSGGQKSLVALSLILAMLLFKPAPIYILDEVDAALDLSHTQNIGNMLKTHFKTSQFIIVSLKDGMFNNANVLFSTKFVDQVSTVIRTKQ